MEPPRAPHTPSESKLNVDPTVSTFLLPVQESGVFLCEAESCPEFAGMVGRGHQVSLSESILPTGAPGPRVKPSRVAPTVPRMTADTATCVAISCAGDIATP